MAHNESLREVIDGWIDGEQNGDDPIDMWISDTLAARMAEAAWAVLEGSRQTQEWLKQEGHMPSEERD